MKKQVVFYFSAQIIWYFNNNWHRDGDLPAIYYFYNYQKKLSDVYYYQHNRLHRATGPAYINYEGKVKEYWYQDKKYGSLEEIQMVDACR